MGSNLALIRNLLFLVAVGLFLQANGFMTSARAVSILCEEVCTESTPCNDPCYENMMEFENGNAIDCFTYDVYDHDAYCCGDNTCVLDNEENCWSCPYDCGACLSPGPDCGANGCEVGENCQNCPSDCGTCGASSSCDYDSKCEDGEDENCQDCQFTGFCEDNEDCPDFQGSEFRYVCMDDRCILEDLPLVTNTCSTDSQCPTGWKCKKAVDGYHGSGYTCPNQQSSCSICVPPWA